MPLVSDVQTAFDLATVEGYYGERSLLSVFNTMKSDGGRQLLRIWMDTPLNDRQAIQERLEAIRTGLPELRIHQEELDFIEYYLSQSDAPTRFSRFDSFFMTLWNKFHTNPQQYIIKRGSELLVQLLKSMDTFFKGVTLHAPALIRSFAHDFRETFSATELKDIFVNTRRYHAKDYYDYLFRYKRYETIRRMLDIVYQLDIIQTVHSVALDRGFCFPEFSDDETFYLKDFYHPHLKNAVKNDWSVGKGNICMLTGSNMAGKSTALRAVSSAVWLAHVGFPVPAASMVCPLFDGIFTSINLPDSMKDGRSHFYTEVLRVKDILTRIGEKKRCFVLFDELFRGTNARDAFEASVAVVDILKEKKESIFLISTHIIELAQHFQKDPSCRFYYLESEIENDELVCRHKLMEGV